MNIRARRIIERLPTMLFVATLAAGGSLASAQTADGSGEAPVAAPPREGETADIVVTANRRSQNLQDVAMSVSALGTEELVRLNVQSGADIVRVTPGVFLSSSAAGQSQQYSIRGVTQNDFNDIFEGPIAVYYDDTYVPSLQGQVFGTFDLERVEVLKGPQGTLFGKNATGGLIHFIPRRPTKEVEGFGEISYGRFNSIRAEGAVRCRAMSVRAPRCSIRARTIISRMFIRPAPPLSRRYRRVRRPARISAARICSQAGSSSKATSASASPSG